MASSSTSSSPLFEQPFSEMNFYESGRLRRRENDSFTTAATQPLFTATPQQQPPYFAHNTRTTRRSNASSGNSSVDRWVPRLFKMILWSPIIVVVVWMTSAVLFTTSSRNNRMPAKTREATVQVRPKGATTTAKQNHHRQNSPGESIKEGFITGVEVLETALGKAQPSRHGGMLPVIAPLGQAAHQQPPRTTRFNKFVQGIGSIVQGKPRKQYNGGVIVQPANLRPPIGAGQPVYQQAPLMQYEGIYQTQGGTSNFPQQEQPAMQYDGIYLQQGNTGNYPQQQQPQQQQPVMQYDGVYLPQGRTGNYPQQQQQPAMQYDGIYMPQGQTGNYPQQQQQEQQPAMQYDGIYLQQGQTGNYAQQQQQEQPAMQYDGVYLQQGQTGNYPEQEAQQQPAMQATGKNTHLRGSTKYLFYNPKDIKVINGQVYLPSQAYDKNGKPHDLTNTKAQVFIQPPPLYGVHHFNHSNVTDSNYTYYHPNTVKTPVYGHHSSSGDKEEEPAKGIAMPNLNTVEGNSSSILVATVGVVALLVGALSARHARGRACLNACLENETLASEAAYDTAHTRANTYSTFWKGDLEKFDV